jgi:hypothetical protein
VPLGGTPSWRLGAGGLLPPPPSPPPTGCSSLGSERPTADSELAPAREARPRPGRARGGGLVARVSPTPRTLGPFEQGLTMKLFLRWGRTRGPRPRYTHRIQPISAGMGEVCPRRAFPRDGPVPLLRTGVCAPPSGPATGKPISLRKPRFRPTLFNTPTLCV